jgi:hypothetical protein
VGKSPDDVTRELAAIIEEAAERKLEEEREEPEHGDEWHGNPD